MIQKSTSNSIIKTYGPLVVVFIIVLLTLPRDTQFPYEYRVGQEWKYETLYASFDFPIYKTSDQYWAERTEAEQAVIPYFRYSEEIAHSSIRKLDILQLDSLSRIASYSLRVIYEKGIIQDSENIASDIIYIQHDKHAVKRPLCEVYTPNQARQKLLSDISPYYDFDTDSLLAVTQVYDLIVPNVIFDAQTTELVKADASKNYSPTSGYVSSGSLIIAQGEILTSEIVGIIDSYRREYESNLGFTSSTWLKWLSNAFIALLFVIMIYLVIRLFCPKLFKQKAYFYVLLIVSLLVAAILITIGSNESILCIIPITIMVLMLQAFFRPSEYLPIYLVTLLPILFFARFGAEYYMMFAMAGTVQALIFKYFRKGWRQFIAALINFAVLSALFLGFKYANLINEPIGISILRIFMGAILTVATYPLIYLLEKLFNLVSDSRLEELSDTSNSLIRKLEQKAPGSFQHSLQLMNMADFAARAIGVNPELVRVGALYHDIGKMNNPLCFIENEFMVSAEDVPKYHAELSPAQSAADIINHVTDGVELARKEHLPQLIIDFILTHHGTTTVRYFYDKHLKAGGDAALVDQFTYKGMKPRTKAEVILMICDSVEAASRTLKTNTAKAYSDFIESIVAGKIAEGQLDEAELSLSELNGIKNSLKQYLAQINHERIVYPKNKNIK